MSRPFAALVALFPLLLAGCNPPDPTPAQARPVRTVVVQVGTGGETMSFTGQIKARDEVNHAFRLDGRLIERAVNVGDTVAAGQLIGRLDPQIQENELRQAQANLSAAQSTLTQARNEFWRQKELLAKGFASTARFDQAQQAQMTAEAQVQSAQAQLRTARERLSYTEIRASAAGAVTAVGAWPGEVVTAGQMIVQLALDGGRDAVFDVPAQTIRAAPRDPAVDISLPDDPHANATGRVREVAPQADPVTRTFRVKVAIIDPPPAFRLGATVVGRIAVDVADAINIPASALTSASGNAAVWIVNPQDQTVVLRAVTIARYGTDSVTISAGLNAGEIVVTAGAQTLRPGQKVRALGGVS